MIDQNDVRWYFRPTRAILHSYRLYPFNKKNRDFALNHACACFNAIAEQKVSEIMAGKGKKKSTAGMFSTEFAAVKLQPEDKAAFDAWLEHNGADFMNYWEIMCGDGWKPSQRWDNENDCYICSATQVDEDDKNHNICVVSRSSNLGEAFLMNYYKIYELFDGKKLPTEAPSQTWG